MAYCRNCGAQIDAQSITCPYCGFPQNVQQAPPVQIDDGNIGWAVLGFFVPLVGLILYLVWKDSKPLSSKQAGKGALIGVIVNACIIFSFIMLTFTILFAVIPTLL